MKKLSPESQSRVDRFYLHRNRCEQIEKNLGSMAAITFHKKWKSDPSSEIAKKEYERLLANN